MDEERVWKVGELARATGLTVRTLHHWDELGLVVPGRRTSSGHRVYSGAEVERVYQVLALRRLGVPLSTIGSLLEGSQDVGEVLAQHLRLVEEQILALRRLRSGLATALKTAADGSPADFVNLIRKVIVVDEIVEK